MWITIGVLVLIICCIIMHLKIRKLQKDLVKINMNMKKIIDCLEVLTSSINNIVEHIAKKYEV